MARTIPTGHQESSIKNAGLNWWLNINENILTKLSQDGDIGQPEDIEDQVLDKWQGFKSKIGIRPIKGQIDSLWPLYKLYPNKNNISSFFRDHKNSFFLI